MKTRIIEKNGTFYPQIKTGIFKWENIGKWWGNLGEVLIDGHICIIHKDFRISTTCFGGFSKKEDAQEILYCLEKQGYLYEPTGVSPNFKDGFMFHYTELTL